MGNKFISKFLLIIIEVENKFNIINTLKNAFKYKNDNTNHH